MAGPADSDTWESDPLSTVEIYTDGSCFSNPGPGGWAAILVMEGEQWYLSEGEPRTTNNRMEMTAAIEGLRVVPEDRKVHVFSDSKYVVNTMTLGWKRKKNLDLWELLDGVAAKRDVTWTWVKGHSGHAFNEKADLLARKEAGAYARGGRRTNVDRELRPQRLPDSLALEDEEHDRAGSHADSELTHVDQEGRGSMVDVGGKAPSDRMAVAKGNVRMAPGTLALIKENAIKKGDVLGIAMVAGITGAKSTSTLIPLCHPLPLDQVTVEFELDEAESSVEITATAKIYAKTGVEMEALTAVSVAALTIYDMCKASDREMRIEGVRLVRKTGGRSGDIELE